MATFALEKRNSFGTVGRLRKLMAKYPDATPLYICGTGRWFYAATDGSLICLDTELLDECYPYENNYGDWLDGEVRHGKALKGLLERYFK